MSINIWDTASSASMQGPIFMDPKDVPEGIREVTVKLIEGYDELDVAKLKAVIDFNEIGMRASSRLFDTRKEQSDFSSGVSSNADKILSTMLKQIELSDGYVKFLGYVKRKDDIYAQFRIDLGETGTDYHEYLIKNIKDNKYAVIDFYQLSTGCLFSENLDAIAQFLFSTNKSILKKLLGIKTIDEDLMKEFQEIGKARREGDFNKAYRILDSLPDDIKKEKNIILLSISLSASFSDPTIYKNKLRELAKYHGDDPALSFMLMDYYFYQENIEKTLDSINKLENQMGEDGFTNFLRGTAYLELAKDSKNAISYYKNAIDIEPDYIDPYFALVEVYISQNEYDNAINSLRLVEQEFEIVFTEEIFAEESEWQDFVNSQPFKNWMREKVK